MADLDYKRKISINGQEIEADEREIIQNRGYNIFQNIMVYLLGGPAILFLIGWLSYSCGQSHPDCRSNCQSTVTVTEPASTKAAVAELEKYRLTVEKMVADAEQKAAAAQVSASATASASTATTTVVAPPPPRTERRVPTTKQAEPACPCPPAESVKVPAPTLSFAEQRRNEMWSALQR